MARQQYTTVIAARGGCDRCAGAQWNGKNAVAQAARHHDATSHPTWAEQTQRTQYGGSASSTQSGTEQGSML